MARLVFDTFPKSGTAWLAGTLKSAYPESEIIWGGHRAATLKKEEQVITAIRNPKDCIPSYMIFFQHNEPGRLLDWYCRFMQGTIDSKDRIFISSFEELTTDPQTVMIKYSKRFLLQEPTPVTVTKIKEQVIKTHLGHLPAPLTLERKRANEIVLSNPDLSAALTMYEKVLTISK